MEGFAAAGNNKNKLFTSVKASSGAMRMLNLRELGLHAALATCAKIFFFQHDLVHGRLVPPTFRLLAKKKKKYSCVHVNHITHTHTHTDRRTMLAYRPFLACTFLSHTNPFNSIYTARASISHT